MTSTLNSLDQFRQQIEAAGISTVVEIRRNLTRALDLLGDDGSCVSGGRGEASGARTLSKSTEIDLGLVLLGTNSLFDIANVAAAEFTVVLNGKELGNVDADSSESFTVPTGPQRFEVVGRLTSRQGMIGRIGCTGSINITGPGNYRVTVRMDSWGRVSSCTAIRR